MGHALPHVHFWLFELFATITRPSQICETEMQVHSTKSNLTLV